MSSVRDAREVPGREEEVQLRDLGWVSGAALQLCRDTRRRKAVCAQAESGAGRLGGVHPHPGTCRDVSGLKCFQDEESRSCAEVGRRGGTVYVVLVVDAGRAREQFVSEAPEGLRVETGGGGGRRLAQNNAWRAGRS